MKDFALLFRQASFDHSKAPPKEILVPVKTDVESRDSKKN
jgi:hypothetical protein